MIIKNEWMIIISRPNIEIFFTLFFILIKTQIYYFTYHISTYIYTGWEKIVKHLLCMQLYFLGIGKFNAFQIHVLHCFLFELHVYLHCFPRTSSIRLCIRKKTQSHLRFYSALCKMSSTAYEYILFF